MSVIQDKNPHSVAERFWRQAVLTGNVTVEQAIRNLDLVAIKIVLIAGEQGELLGTISDGDIRRGLLRGLSMGSSIDSDIHRNPLVVPPDMARDLVLQLMVANKVQQIPVVDEQRRVVGLHLWDEINATLIELGRAGLIPTKDGGVPIVEKIGDNAVNALRKVG